MPEWEYLNLTKDQNIERCEKCTWLWEGIDGQSYCTLNGFGKAPLCLDIPFCEYASKKQRVENYPDNMDYLFEFIDYINGKAKVL